MDVDKDIAEIILSLKSKENGCDVHILLSKERLPVHSVVLGSRSEYFGIHLFSTPLVPKEITLHDEDPDSVKTIIDYCYNSLTLNSFLKSSIDNDNVLKILTLAKTYQIEKLKNNCAQYVLEYLEHFKDFTKETKFDNMKADVLVDILKVDGLIRSEVVIYNFVKRWVNLDMKERSRYLSDILKYVKLSRLSMEDLVSDSIKICDTDDGRCLSYFLRAINEKRGEKNMQIEQEVPEAIDTEIKVDCRGKDKIEWEKREAERRNAEIEEWERKEEDRRTKQQQDWDRTEEERRLKEKTEWERREMELRIREKMYLEKREAERNAEIREWEQKEEDRRTKEKLNWGKTEEARRLKEKTEWERREEERRNSPMLVIGAFDDEPAKVVERYDLRSKTWLKVEIDINRNCFRCVLHKDKLIAMGGWYYVPVNDVDSFDTTTWKRTALAPLKIARYGFVAVTDRDFVYAIGGKGRYATCLSSVEKFDPTTNAWTLLADMPTARMYPGAAIVNNSIYVIGGYDGKYTRLAINECFSEQTGQWRTCSPMKENRSSHGIASIKGFVYVVGGKDGENYSSTVERYDPSLDTWTYVKSISIPRYGIGATNFGGKLVISGGELKSGSRVDTVEEYDPQKDEWTTLPSLNVVRYQHNIITTSQSSLC